MRGRVEARARALCVGRGPDGFVKADVDMDHDNGKNKGGKYFEYDMALAGPAIGFVFTF